MDSDFRESTALIAVSGVFLGFGAIFLIIVLADIVWRRGWSSMMWIMIPTYIINASYMGPLTLYLYFKYGRAKKPEKAINIKWDQQQHQGSHSEHEHNHVSSIPYAAEDIEKQISADEEQPQGHHGGHEHHADHKHHEGHAPAAAMHSHHNPSKPDKAHGEVHDNHNMNKESHDNMHNMSGHAHMHEMGTDRPTWATIFIGVSHCGAGCVLGDLVGEWLVYGTGVMINGHDIWPALLIDYGFALLFGIVFQYFSIAPMSGEYGLKTVIRAAKADILSLTSFEIGLFAWMIIYQVGIWEYKLEMNTWTYWWQMQIGMFFGFWTAIPVNWWLITRGIKEPCA